MSNKLTFLKYTFKLECSKWHPPETIELFPLLFEQFLVHHKVWKYTIYVDCFSVQNLENQKSLIRDLPKGGEVPGLSAVKPDSTLTSEQNQVHMENIVANEKLTETVL